MVEPKFMKNEESLSFQSGSFCPFLPSLLSLCVYFQPKELKEGSSILLKVDKMANEFISI